MQEIYEMGLASKFCKMLDKSLKKGDKNISARKKKSRKNIKKNK